VPDVGGLGAEGGTANVADVRFFSCQKKRQNKIKATKVSYSDTHPVCLLNLDPDGNFCCRADIPNLTDLFVFFNVNASRLISYCSSEKITVAFYNT
jgi:hypothetical protein